MVGVCRTACQIAAVGWQVQAELPMLAVEEKESDFYLDSEWLGDRNAFLLRVQGHSMIDAGIVSR
jgi:SOS-response transcriptional repressor LexA